VTPSVVLFSLLFELHVRDSGLLPSRHCVLCSIVSHPHSTPASLYSPSAAVSSPLTTAKGKKAKPFALSAEEGLRNRSPTQTGQGTTNAASRQGAFPIFSLQNISLTPTDQSTAGHGTVLYRNTTACST
jgi:hypothetical protein